MTRGRLRDSRRLTRALVFRGASRTRSARDAAGGTRGAPRRPRGGSDLPPRRVAEGFSGHGRRRSSELAERGRRAAARSQIEAPEAAECSLRNRLAEFARRRGRARRASRQRRQRASNARHGSPPRDRGTPCSRGVRGASASVGGSGAESPRRRFRASRRAGARRLADCRFLGPAAHARESHDGLAHRSARWRTYPWGRWNYSRRDPATRVSACDSADVRTTCRKSSAWPRRASFLRARLDGDAPTFFRAYLKWTALRLSLTRLARPSRIRKQQERETVQQTQGRNLRVTVLPGPPRGTTQTPCASHPAKTSHATRHRKDPLLALRKVSFF